MSLEEPLSVIAPLAAETAQHHCCRLDDAGVTCDWYHGTIDYLRLLDLVISPADHAGFYVPILERLAREPAFGSVLVSGAGDCSMLAQVLAGLRATAGEPTITLIDRCETPLILNSWFARRHGRVIETVVTPVLDYDGGGRFDVVCTHCFLGYFTPEQRPALMTKWFSLLRPGGRVLTVNPIRQTPDHAFVPFTPAQAASFEARAMAAAEARPERLGDARASFRDRVQAFTASFGSYPVRSVEELRGLFEAAGFVVEEIGPLPGGQPGGTGPTEPGLPFFAVNARRP